MNSYHGSPLNRWRGEEIKTVRFICFCGKNLKYVTAARGNMKNKRERGSFKLQGDEGGGKK